MFHFIYFSSINNLYFSLIKNLYFFIPSRQLIEDTLERDREELVGKAVVVPSPDQEAYTHKNVRTLQASLTESTIDSEGFKGGTRGAPIMPRDVSLSDSTCWNGGNKWVKLE